MVGLLIVVHSFIACAFKNKIFVFEVTTSGLLFVLSISRAGLVFFGDIYVHKRGRFWVTTVCS